MLKISRYQDINLIENETKKDYVDRHSPFVLCKTSAKVGEKFEIKVRMGQEYEHPDDFDHYISNISIFDKDRKLAEATFYAGALGGQGKKGHQEVTFYVLLEKDSVITAQSYCTKHGIWESDPIKVSVK